MRRRVVAGVALVGLLVAGCGDDERTFEARFADARGLVEGNDVRVGGAVAGRVEGLALAPDGSARVRFTVARDDLVPKADAVAAIRPVDLLGDTFLALSPGTSPRALDGPIPVARTSNAPRLDELLASFRPAVRDALRALLVEGGLALDARGEDVARAAVALRPALRSAEGVARELQAQRGALAALVPVAERAATRLAARSADVGPLVDGLARTLDATAAETPALRASLAGLPATLDRLRGTTGRVERTAVAARPAARSLAAGASDLGAAVDGLPALTARAETTAKALRPLVRAGRELLVDGNGTFAELGRTLTALRTGGPALARLTAALAPAAEGIAQGFLTEFPDQAAEPGTQPFDPFADKRRGYWRGAAVFSCEAFGLEVEPGCLAKAFPAPKAKAEANAKDRAPSAPSAPKPTPAAPKPAVPVLPQVTEKLPPSVKQPLEDATKEARDAVGGLLDFLLTP